jgi:FixJ family two-component response regulator
VRRCREVVRQLTPRQRVVLRVFAQGAGSVEAAARRLQVSAGMVNCHKTVILEHCRNAWGLAPGERLTYHFLRGKFGAAMDEAWND